MPEPSIIERSVEKAHVWLDEVAAQLGTDDHRQAYRALRDRIAADAQLDGETAASYATGAVAEVLRRHVSAGEIEDIRAQLPEDLLPILG
jgi:uncharacterized protein (DUF2267 family)